MAGRLGQTLYWFASGVAALLVLLAGLAKFASPAQPDDTFWVGFYLAAALLIWLLGRALKYVLAGK